MIRFFSAQFAPLALSLCTFPALAQGLDALPHPATARPVAKPASKPQAVPPKAVKPRANPFGLPSPAHRDSLGGAASDPNAVLLDNPPGEEAPLQVPTPKPAPVKTPKTRAMSVGGISIKGLNDTKAVRVLRVALAPKLRANVDVFDGQTIHLVRRDKLGATIPYLALIHQARKSGGDVPLRFQIDRVKARRTLRALAVELTKPTLQTVSATEAARPFKTTLALDGSLMRVKAALEAQPPQNRVELVVARVALPIPAPKTDAPASDAPRDFPYLLAAFATPYDAGVRGRTNNLKMAAKHVNGTIVKDGDVFSANGAIGRRDAAAGWREAKMFVGGQVVTGIGAGICQCSTTIYNAALLANLPIVERHQHMFRVSYAQASRDAAIYWGQKDMKWRNNTGGPILVRTFLRGGKFHARLYGTVPNTSQVEIASHTLSRQGGTRSEAFRIVRTSDGVVKQRLSRDFYRPHP